MNVVRVSLQGCVVRICTKKPSLFTEEELADKFAEFGSIKRTSIEASYIFIYFKDEADARYCAQKLSPNESNWEMTNTDPDSIGDTITKPEEKPFAATEGNKKEADGNRRQSKVLNVISMLTPKLVNLMTRSTSYTKEDPFITDCTSPVLLNIVNPGFRLTYFDNVPTIKATNLKSRKFHRFNESIKKYMGFDIMKYVDNAPIESGTHEFIITNLPADFKEQDVYQLCGNIKPEYIEMKTTSNINVLYASIKTKTREDFEKLMPILGNKQINGSKITTIPISKISHSPLKQTDDQYFGLP